MNTKEEQFLRYSSQTKIGEFGKEGQKLLSVSEVMIVGCGALGSVIAMYLAGAGVGTLILADFDTIDISNLQRQIFYKEEETGKSKAEILEKRILELNSTIKTQILKKPVTKKLLETINAKPDIIIDAADNPATTYLLEEYCASYRIPLSTAGVTEWKAQIMSYLPGKTKFSEVFSPFESSVELLPCSISGVFGPLTGLVAAIQASEAIKILLNKGKLLVNSLLIIDLFNNKFDRLDI